MKRTKLTEKHLRKVIARVIKEQDTNLDNPSGDDFDAEKVAESIVDGYAKNGPIKTDRAQLQELYYMYRHLVQEAMKTGGKISENDYNQIMDKGMNRHGITAPLLPYVALQVLSKYV